jgi:ribosomal protein S18 acetylase RimI-like enzyme
MTTHIRRATPADADIITRFNRAIAAETEDLTLDEPVVARGVRRLLADERRGRYWVAERDGQVVGQIMVTFEWSDWRDGRVWWLQSVYVAPDHRRRGVFTALYEYIQRELAADADACGLRLYVEETNHRAQATYRALGMRMTHYRVMETMAG